MEERSQQLLQLENIQAQLTSDDPVLHATSKFTVTHLTFNAFKKTWPLTSAYHHVQIGVRHGRFVHVFPTRNGGAIYTVAPGRYPDLKSVDISCETLEDVGLVAPFDAVEEWKSELSGSLSREFRVLLKYLFLLHAAEGGRYKNLGLPVDVEDLKVALMMVHQARLPKTSPPSPGSIDASDAEPSPELTDTPPLSGPIMTTREEPATEAHPADEPAVPDADSAASGSMQLDGQVVDLDSSSDATHEDLPPLAPTSASTLVPGYALEDIDDELEGVDDAAISLVPEKSPNDPTSEDSDQPESRIVDSAPRGPVKGLFTVSGPDRRRPTRKQVVPVADGASETEDGHFIASSRKDSRNKSKPPDDRRTGDAAKAVRFAEEQTGAQPDTPASADGTVGFDDEIDIEIIESSEPDENTHQNPPYATSESPDADAESQHDAHMDVVQDPRSARQSNQGLIHDARGIPIERIAFQAAAQPPP
ncbi:hypothetical protein E8E11_003045 [Didymella keratinophila]|nr:hypothetical protein E8E11_003045 [Didymella keratinophila]